MSANIEASLRLEIAQMQAALAKARGDITKLKEHAKREGAGLGQNLFKGLLALGGTGALIAAGNAALGTVTKMDRMNRAMLTLEGSAQRAEARLAELRETSRLPGIGFEQAVAGDIRLRAVGLSADESKRALVEFGNALALAGGTASDLDGVILALGQIASKGKVSAEEINQIAERVPQVRAVMKNVFGTADTEVLQKMEMSAEQFITRLIDGFGQLQRASAGLDEQLNDAQQSINTMINDAAGPVVNELVPAFAELTSSLADNKDAFVSLGTTAVRALGGIAEMLGMLNEVGSGLGEGIGKMLGFDDVYNTSAGSANQRAQDAASADEALAKYGPARQYDEQGNVRKPEEGKPDSKKPGGTPPPEIVDKSAAAKKLREEEQARKALLEEQNRLSRLQLDDYLSILAPNLKLIEVQRQILTLRENIETLPMHEIDKLKMQQELVRWQAEERAVKADIADEAKRAADEARKQAEESASQTQSGADFDAEMAIIDARLKGNRDLADELQRQYDIEQLKRQIMEQQGASAEDALSKATARVDAERRLNDEITKTRNARYDDQGRREDGRRQIKGYSAETQGGAADARQRAADRVADTRDRLQKDYDRAFPGLGGEAPAGTPESRSQLATKAAASEAASRTPAAGPAEQAAQLVVSILPQILSTLTGS